MVEPLRHRQTKEAETDMFDLQPPRHISTLPKPEITAPQNRRPLLLALQTYRPKKAIVVSLAGDGGGESGTARLPCRPMVHKVTR
jgi:hypothetical protein